MLLDGRVSISHSNPYEAPSNSNVLPRSRPLAAVVFVLSLLVHLNCLAMVTAWTWYWINGSIVPKTDNEFVAYICGFLCLIASGTVMIAVVLRQRKLQLISALLCATSIIAIAVVL
jgi:hypothetical protein